MDKPQTPWWVLPGLGAMGLLVFAGALVGTFITGNQTNQTQMQAVAGSLAGMVFGYFFGSSAGSRAKDDTSAKVAELQAANGTPPIEKSENV